MLKDKMKVADLIGEARKALDRIYVWTRFRKQIKSVSILTLYWEKKEMDRLEVLRKKDNAKSIDELISHALATYEVLIDEIEFGHEIRSYNRTAHSHSAITLPNKNQEKKLGPSLTLVKK